MAMEKQFFTTILLCTVLLLTSFAYAVEFDFAEKWAEAVGQALYYALKTGKKPAVVLIMEDPRGTPDISKG